MKRLVLFLLAGICLLACEKDNEAVVEPVPEPAPAPERAIGRGGC